MGEVRINIKDLLQRAFGNGIVQAYALTGKELQAASSQVTVLGGEGQSSKMLFDDGDETGEGTGLLGLPVFQQIKFTDGDSSLYLGDSLVDIQMTRTIVRTQVNGRTGTIKEFITNGDYEINIKGFLVSSNPYKAPEKEIREFKEWFVSKKKAVGVQGRMFELFDIHNVVVESWSFPQLPTYINLRPYELKCYSDDLYEIMLEKDN